MESWGRLDRQSMLPWFYQLTLVLFLSICEPNIISTLSMQTIGCLLVHVEILSEWCLLSAQDLILALCFWHCSSITRATNFDIIRVQSL
jgi:hypothetical protein